MILRKPLASLFLLALVSPAFSARPLLAQEAAQPAVLGYPNFTAEARIEERFLAVPSARLAGEELKTLTREPHVASTPEDYKTAEYVAQKFRAAGLETEIVPYRVLIDLPRTVRVQAYGPGGKLLMSGPTREHVQGDPYQDDPRVVMPYNSSSGSGDVTAAVVYANYGRLEDFDQLAARHIDLRGKIVLCRYGGNFRGVKVYIAEQRGAAGVLLYSDPQDDGYVQGDAYPLGPWRPETGVQRGSVQYLFKYPGDPETPGVASTVDLPDSARNKSAEGPYGNQPHIISIPLSYHDAAPILKALAGPGAPQGWQGGLPFRYHIGEVGGSGAVQVHLVSGQGQGLGVSGRMGGGRQSPRRLGLRRGRSQQRHRCPAGSGSRHRRAARPGLAAPAHNRLLQLGRRGRGVDRLNRVGGAERQSPATRRGLLQYRRGRLRTGFLRLLRSFAPAIRRWGDPLGSQSAGRHRL
jgi:N-acetylated-alpha-linked acidic dipeptidase